MASGQPVIDGEWSPAGFQQITDLSAAVALTVPTNARIAIINPEGQAVRWRDIGGDPTGTVGMVIAVGDTFTYNGNLHAIKFIEAAGGAKLNVSYYK